MKRFGVKFLVCLSLVMSLALTAQAGVYHLIAGSSELGFRENDKQNVNLGFHAVFNELLNSENVTCDFKSYENYEALAEAVKEKKVNAFFGSPIELIKSEHYFLSAPLASGVFNKDAKSKIYIIVKNDSNIKNLTQLKGKKIAMQKWISSDTAGIFLETVLMENHLPLQGKFFSEIVEKETSNRALVDLHFNKVDAILVNQTQYDIAVELNPQLRLENKILVASEPYLIFVAALSKETPENAIAAIKHSLLTVDKTAKGRSIMNLMKMHSFKEIASQDLDNVRALMAKHEKLKARYAH